LIEVSLREFERNLSARDDNIHLQSIVFLTQ